MLKKPQNIFQLKKIDISEIKHFTNSLSDSDWSDWQLRQSRFLAHSQTKTYPLLWSNNINSKSLVVIRKNLTSKIWKVLNPLLSSLSYEYNSSVVKCMFANLPATCSIAKHQDTADILVHSHRIHIPIQTSNNVKFYLDNEEYSLEEGFVYEINNQKFHSVKNLSRYDRIHLIIDLLPYHKNIEVLYINDDEN